MQAPGEGELLIHSRSRHEAEVALAPGETLRWALRVGTHRLNVGVTLRLTSEDGTLERTEPLREMGSLCLTDGIVGGTYSADTAAHVGQPGEQRVVFTLDNTFSRSSAKVLVYKVWITNAQDELRDRNIAAALSGCTGDSSPPPPPPPLVELEFGVYPRIDAAEADWNELSARLRKDGWTAPGPEFDGKGGASLVGHRVFVRGRGEGRVLEYTQRKMRASSHEILFHDGALDCEVTTIYLASSAEGNKTLDGGYLPYLIDFDAVIRICAEELKQVLPATGTVQPSANKHTGLPWRVEDASAWCRVRNMRGEHVSAHSRTPQHLAPPLPSLTQIRSAEDTARLMEDCNGVKAGTGDSGCIPEGECSMPVQASAESHHFYETFVMLGVGNSLKEKHREVGQDPIGNLHCEPELLAVYPHCDDPKRRESLRMFCCPDSFEVRSVQVSQGQIPQSPSYEQYIFRMTEGLAAPVPLFGVCVKTQELITIEAPRCIETGATTAIETVDSAAAEVAPEAADVAQAAADVVSATTNSVAARRRGIRIRRGRRAVSAQGTQGDSGGLANSSATVYLAPRCYCLLSRSPHFDMLFATLYGLLRSERLHCIKDQVVLDVEVPAEQHSTTRHWVEVVHADGVYTALLPGLRRCLEEDKIPERDTGNAKRTVLAGQHFQLTVPSAWRSRDLSVDHEDYSIGEMFQQSLARARLLQPGAVGSTFRIPASVFGVECGGPDEIQNRPTAYSLWALGTALEHCSVEVLLSAATALLLERPLIVLHPSKSARSAVAFALLALLGPWRYPHTCLPLVPPMMYELATAPVPFLLGMPGQDDLVPFGQDARAASVLCATTGELREGTPPGVLDAEATAACGPHPESVLGSEPEPDAAVDTPYTPRETVYGVDEQAAGSEMVDPSFMTLSELEFGQALLGQGGVASLSSQLKPKAAALWQARRSGHSNSDAENRAVRNFMCTVMDFHAKLGMAIAAGECGDTEVQEDPFVQQFKLSSIWEQYGKQQDV